MDKELGKVAPYGIYDIFRNEGWVSVGISSDTAQFAVNSIRTWYQQIAIEKYGAIKKIMITADCSGSNGNRVRLWKKELQGLSNETGLEIHVCHYPPGTSKWNKIEHRMFSFISQNWKGKPLLTRQTVIDLIRARA
ncbi:MAG: ISAzo13 family transposase [SAR324 cluster bacterium]|nr:ISAzo13 family transposase [SAR324 cluster bacterium]